MRRFLLILALGNSGCSLLLAFDLTDLPPPCKAGFSAQGPDECVKDASAALGETCSRHQQCEEGLVCYQFSCRIACSDDSDCTAGCSNVRGDQCGPYCGLDYGSDEDETPVLLIPTCLPAPLTCVESCTTATDCLAGYDCTNAVCVLNTAAPCTDDTDCAGASLCDTGTGACVECLEDDDCDPVGCFEGLCRGCQVGGSQCTAFYPLGECASTDDSDVGLCRCRNDLADAPDTDCADSPLGPDCLSTGFCGCETDTADTQESTTAPDKGLCDDSPDFVHPGTHYRCR